MMWKSDWDTAREAMLGWWRHADLALAVSAPAAQPWADIAAVAPAPDLPTRWLDPGWRVASDVHRMAHTFHGGIAFPHAHVNIGPGSLGLFLGQCEGHLSESTVWYEPKLMDADSGGVLQFDPHNVWFARHLDLIDAFLAASQGRYLVGMPDLIENIDTLAQLRDPQVLLMDLIERPTWVKQKLEEINQAYFECFDRLYQRLQTPWGGNVFCAFGLWGPGKTGKVQCDFSCMISDEMFREFVVPPLRQQCAWLDWSMYHLDGTQALHHLPALLEIEDLDAIEWTSETPEHGGHPRWYDLYRTIKRAGKSVQAIGVAPEEVEPLIDAVGPEGMYITCQCSSEHQARELLRRCGWPPVQTPADPSEALCR